MVRLKTKLKMERSKQPRHYHQIAAFVVSGRSAMAEAFFMNWFGRSNNPRWMGNSYCVWLTQGRLQGVDHFLHHGAKHNQSLLCGRKEGMKLRLKCSREHREDFSLANASCRNKHGKPTQLQAQPNPLGACPINVHLY